MKSSFNAFGQTKKVYGATSTPVWLGVVGPVPVGGTLAKDFVVPGGFYPAGTPVNLTNKVITPLVSFGVLGYKAGAENDVVTVYSYIPGFEFEAGDNIMKVGATFATKGTGIAVVSVKKTENGQEITIAHQESAAFAIGDSIVEASGAGASKSIKGATPNHYLYNDINLGDIDTTLETAAATGACVRYHADGLLIDRTPAAEMAEACAAAIPGVLQVKG